MAAIEYALPQSIDEAVAVLSSRPESRPLAGGQRELLGRSRDRSKNRVLVDLRDISSLKGIRQQGDGVWIGAMATLNEIAANNLVRSQFPTLAEVAATVGDPQLRNRATLGGNLAEGDPEYDFPALLIALDTNIEVAGPRGRRKVAAEELFDGRGRDSLSSGELIVGATIPAITANTGTAYVRFKHPARLTAVCGVAAVLTVEHGHVVKGKIVVTGATEHPSRFEAVEKALLKGAANGDKGASATAISTEGMVFRGDTYASADYRRHLAQILTGRAVKQALGRINT